MGAAGDRKEPKRQGDRFEETLGELLLFLLRDELELEAVEVIRQPSGLQGGRDLQVRWKSRHGVMRNWHVECKDLSKVVSMADISEKLLQETMAPHDIDVWCLATPETEPSKEVDDFIASQGGDLPLGFRLSVLSRARGGIHWLYACNKDLYRRQYRKEPPTQSAREKARCLEELEKRLEFESNQRPRRILPGWTTLTPSRVGEPPDETRTARSYLRGLTVKPPWAAVVHGWSVPRRRTEAKLEEALAELAPGFRYEWLIGAGGEGKSTVLKRFAWSVLSDHPDVQVLWTEDGESTQIPTDWLEAHAPGSRVLICVDGSSGLTGLGDALAAGEHLASRGVAVLAVIADRGTLWRMHMARQRIAPRLRSEPIPLDPLGEEEQGELLDRLEGRGLLVASARPGASTRLSKAVARAAADARKRRWERAWLVPTMLECTDPEGRPFERILASVLEELLEMEAESSLRLLLAISLLHAAGPALPPEIAERLVGSPTAYTRSVEVLDEELERKLDSATGLQGDSSNLRTHGAAVGEGFVGAAIGSDRLRPWLLAVCKELPELMRPEYTARAALREDRFELLDGTARYLHRLGEPTLSVGLLSSWVELDPLAFIALQRLGVAYLRWLRAGLETGLPDARLVELADQSRDRFREAQGTGEWVLSQAQVPEPYASYTVLESDSHCYHAWGDLEYTLGRKWESAKVGGRSNLVSAAYLTMLSLGTARLQAQKSSGQLARILIALGEPELAAPIVSWCRSVGGSVNDIPPALRRTGSEASTDPVAGIPATLAGITEKVLAPSWDELGVKTDPRSHQRLLSESLVRFLRELRIERDAEIVTAALEVPA